MKTNILVLLLLCISMVLISGCGEVEGIGEYLGVLSTELDLDKQYGTSEVVIDENMALKIGDVYLHYLCSEDALADTTLTAYELEGRDFYVVTRSPISRAIAGGEYNVAINKNGGGVIKVWIGE